MFVIHKQPATVITFPPGTFLLIAAASILLIALIVVGILWQQKKFHR